MAEHRIWLEKHGGAEVLHYEDFILPPPAAGEVQVRHQAIGLNFIDIYHRTGLYPIPLPGSLGTEAAGIVECVGPDIKTLKPGDRVAYATAPVGAYTSARNLDAQYLVPVPDMISSEEAAASLLKGMTAEFLIERCAQVKAGQTVLVHAAAGGVGSILVQWLSAIGARVLAHSGTPRKAEQISANGADAVSTASLNELPEWVAEQTQGQGADIIFDGVGHDSWNASLKSIAKRGTIASFGNASGPVPAFSMLDLLKAGSIFVTRPTLFDYCASRDALIASSDRLFQMISTQKVKVTIGQHFKLKDVAQAQEKLAARQTNGATILIP